MRALKIAVAVCVGLVLASAAATAGDNKAEKKGETKPTWTGTVKVEGKKSKFALAEMAKATMPDVVRTALADVKAGDADKKIVDVELDAESGFLVWEVEVAVRDKDGVMKVIVDAGSGKVLENKHEKDEDEKQDKKDKKSK